jgi:hypothetical protein
MYENGKMRPVETIPGMGAGGERKMMEGWIQLWNSVSTLVNVTMCPQYKNWNKISMVGYIAIVYDSKIPKFYENKDKWKECVLYNERCNKVGQEGTSETEAPLEMKGNAKSGGGTEEKGSFRSPSLKASPSPWAPLVRTDSPLP